MILKDFTLFKREVEKALASKGTTFEKLGIAREALKADFERGHSPEDIAEDILFTYRFWLGTVPLSSRGDE